MRLDQGAQAQAKDTAPSKAFQYVDTPVRVTIAGSRRSPSRLPLPAGNAAHPLWQQFPHQFHAKGVLLQGHRP